MQTRTDAAPWPTFAPIGCALVRSARQLWVVSTVPSTSSYDLQWDNYLSAQHELVGARGQRGCSTMPARQLSGWIQQRDAT